MASRRIRGAVAAVIGLVTAVLALASPAQAGASASVRPASVGNYFELLNLHTNKCADVEGNSRSSGAVVHQWSCAQGDNQLWAAERIGDPAAHVIRLRNLHSQLCMTAGSPYTNGAVITQQWCDSGNTDDWWRVSVDGDGFFKLIHVPSGRCLDLNNGSSSDGAKIQLWDCSTASNAQDWYNA
jgi:hypothetical protein